MKLKAFLIMLVLVTLSGCDVLSGSRPEVLPTIILDSVSTPIQATSVPRGDEIIASGVVVPAQLVQLAATMGGSVKTVDAAVGDRVKTGQVLVRMAGNEKLAATLESANLELLSAQQALKALNDDAERARTVAQLRLAYAQKELDKVQKRRAGQQFRYGSQSTIEAAQADLVLANDTFKKAEEDYNDVAYLPEDDLRRARALSVLAAARKVRDRAEANLNYLIALPDAIDVDQVEAELQVALTEADNAQKEFDKLKDGPDPDALALVLERIKNAEAQIIASHAALTELELTAPFDGTICDVNIHPGGWMTPGQPILMLADLEHFQVETTDLNERYVPKISLDQPVTVFIKALGQDVTGHVSIISPLADTLGGDVVYKTTIDLDTVPPGLRAGMSVEVRFLDAPSG